MKATLRLEGRYVNINWTREGSECRYQFESEPERAVSVEIVEPDVYLILSGGVVHEARIEREGEEPAVVIAGHRFPFEALDERSWKGKAAHGKQGGPLKINAPMPGKIVRVLAQVGDAVTAGQGLLVMEAMKMQNEMKSPRDGRVTSVSVAASDTVKAGQHLFTLE